MKINMRKTTDVIDIDTVYVKDFGDNYHRLETDPSDELTRDALGIRRVYKKQNEYRRAVATFNEYLETLMQKYGGPTMFRLALIANTVTEHLPPIPRLKSKKYGKLFKKGVIMSEFSMSKVTDDDILRGFDEVNPDYDQPIYMAKVDAKMKGYKHIEKLIAQHASASNSMLNQSRDISILENYFARRHREEEDERVKTGEEITLTEMLSDDFYEILEGRFTDKSDELISYNGKLVSRDQLNNLEVINELYKLGWNTTKILNALGGDDALLQITKNERKADKKAKKSMKKAESYYTKLVADSKYSSFDAFTSEIASEGDKSIFARFED